MIKNPQSNFTEHTIKNLSKSPVGVRDEGFPGFLTDSQYMVYERFKTEVAKRDSAFRNTIFSFGYEEDEAFALCRWLRARKFELHAVIEMVEAATNMRREPAKNNFYPDPEKALGVEPSIYIAQYPQLYCGIAKEGYPLFISKPGVLNISGIECITTIEGILRYHWFAMIHDFAARLREQKSANPKFNRFEVVCIIDLENLAVSNVGKRPMNIIKVQSEVDSLCFPETLNRFIIVNAPSAFSMIWNVIKGWIDARTAAKVEIHSYRKKWEPRLLELIDPAQLPSDYGGKAKTTISRLESENKEPDVKRQYVQTLSVCKYLDSEKFELNPGEEMEIIVMTRSLKEGKFTFVSLDDKLPAMTPMTVKHLGKGSDEEDPTRKSFPTIIRGPCKFQFRVECNTGSWSSENFLIAGKVRDATSQAGTTKQVSKATTSVVQDVSKENRTPPPDTPSKLRPVMTTVKLRDSITDSFEHDFAQQTVCHDDFSREKMVLQLIQRQRQEMEKKKLRQKATSPNKSITSSSNKDSPPSFTVVDPQDEQAYTLGWKCGGNASLDGVLGLWKGPN